MAENMLVYALMAVTFALAIVFGVVQWNKAKKARETHEHSAAERQQGTNAGNAVPAATQTARSPDRTKKF
jgi:uncharacterized protein HemX